MGEAMEKVTESDFEGDGAEAEMVEETGIR
jgi:hypothetical protein